MSAKQAARAQKNNPFPKTQNTMNTTKTSQEKYTSLTARQKGQLVMWIAANKEVAAKETYVDAALIAEQQLGFHLTHCNMAWGCQACGIEKQGPRRTGGNKDRVRALALIVRNMSINRGEEIPADLQRLISGNKLTQQPVTYEIKQH
jgi:hypothetical protein